MSLPSVIAHEGFEAFGHERDIVAVHYRELGSAKPAGSLEGRELDELAARHHIQHALRKSASRAELTETIRKILGDGR